MLNSLRKGAGTWVAKIFIALLVLSFGIWGIADVFSGRSSRVLATVGDTKISLLQYQQELQREVRRLSIQFRQPLSREQVRAFGIDRLVLNNLVTNAALTNHARQLGLGISDQSIRDAIEKNPSFKNKDGKFSRIQFDAFLRNNDMNENSFFAKERNASLRRQLVLSLTDDLAVPDSMKDILYHYNNDTRTLEYFILSPKAVKEADDPDEKTQQAFLEGNKRLFTAPEYRQVGLLTLSPALVKKSIKITDQQIADHYKSHLDQYSIPGKRHIRRMSFIDRDKALEAYKELDKGADFMAVAQKYGFRKDGTDMGFIDKIDLLDAKVANTAFSLQKGKISAPIKSSFSTIIIQVVDIKPGKVQKKLPEVREQIRTFLTNEQIADKLDSLRDTIEDDRAGGKKLSDIARDNGLSYQLFKAIDRAGHDPQDKTVKDFPQNPRLFTAIFESDIGVENEPVEGRNGAVYWPEVLSVTPQRVKKLAEVKTKLITLWKKRQREKALSKLASDIVADLRKDKKLASVAKKYKAQVKKSKAFTRSQEHDDIPAAAVNQAFVLPVGGIGMNSLSGEKGRVIFKVIDKGLAKAADKKEKNKLTVRLRQALADDVVGQYIAGLRKKYGVSIKRKVLERANSTL